MRPYYILAPEYRHNSAGVRVLYKLRDKLEEAGKLARIVQGADDALIDKIQNENAIAVYPEIITGNPFKAKHVARWVLYYPGVLAGDKVYDDREMVFSYSRLYNSSIQNKIQGNLFLPDIDLNIFKNYGFERRGSAYYVGKGVLDNSKIELDSIEITKDFPSTREALALIFNFVNCFYCFDPSTIMIHEAEFCGCNSILCSDNREAHINTELSYGQFVDVKNRYLQAEKDFELQLKHFIEVTQNDL